MLPEPSRHCLSMYIEDQSDRGGEKVIMRWAVTFNAHDGIYQMRAHVIDG